MKLRELTIIKDAQINYELKDEQRFIYNYGLFNCKILKAKDSRDILKIMREQMPNEELSSEQVNFINEISNKEVLVHISNCNDDRPSIFVYPEDDTPFSVECFV